MSVHPGLASPAVEAFAQFPPQDVWERLLSRYDRPVPRYTSYPTVPNWRDEPRVARDRVLGEAAVDVRARTPLALYVHVPFCRSLCWYCACNRHITHDTALVDRYLSAVETELEAVHSIVGSGRIGWLHWGGGTPNSLSSEQISRLFRAVASRFAFADDVEISAEIDPRCASRGQIGLLASLGFNRLSFGVQDLQVATQQAVNRIQPFEETESAIAWAREFGIDGINLDVIYGLPLQTRTSFAQTIRQLIGLRPDRVAAYAYAHVPWVNHAQRTYEDLLPAKVEKFGMAVDTARAFVRAGYEPVGIDHYARSEDPLAAAQRNGLVARSFMGYSPRRTGALIGVGASAISSSRTAFCQNEPSPPAYVQAMEDDRPAVRGCLVTPDDKRRQIAIEEIMTRGRLPTAEAMSLALDRCSLSVLQNDGIVTVTADTVALTPIGRLFARNVASCFDAHATATDGRHASSV